MEGWTSCRWRCTGSTARARSPRSSARSTSPSRSAAGAAQRPDQPRLPVLRAARLRQDLQRPDPGPVAELREGPDPDAVRGVRLLRGAGPERAGQPRRHRDRRGVARWRRRRPRPARARVLRAGSGRASRSTSSTRRTWSRHSGLQRAAQAGRGAAAAPEVHLRDHRAGQGARHHPVAHAPLPVPADPAGDACASTSEASVPAEGVDVDPLVLPAGRAGRRRLGARRAVGARPAARRRRARGRHLRPGGGPARRHRRRAARRDGRRARRRRRRGGLRRRRPGGRGRPRSAPVRRRPARAVPRPADPRRGARRRRPRACSTRRPTSSSGCAARPSATAGRRCRGPPT